MLKFIGDDQLDALATIKSKEELIEKSLITSITSTKSYFCFKINLLEAKEVEA
jgi:hypothetical protein